MHESGNCLCLSSLVSTRGHLVMFHVKRGPTRRRTDTVADNASQSTTSRRGRADSFNVSRHSHPTGNRSVYPPPRLPSAPPATFSTHDSTAPSRRRRMQFHLRLRRQHDRLPRPRSHPSAVAASTTSYSLPTSNLTGQTADEMGDESRAGST